MNVIVLVADSWQFNYLGCYGNPWIQTPNLDAFAARSVVFENAYAEASPTVPTRRAFLTGRYTLPYGGWQALGPQERTLTDILWSQPLYTALVSDTSPLRLPGFGYTRGFDYVRFFRGQEFDRFYSQDPCSLEVERFHKPAFITTPAGKREESRASLYCRHELENYLPQRQHWRTDQDQMVAQVVRGALDYLERRDRGRPFLLWLDSFDPHEPWDPPSVWDRDRSCPYDPDYQGQEIINPVPTYVEGYLDQAEQHHIRMLYAEKITVVDKWLGKVLDRLEEEGLYQDSLVIFVSDHGQPLGQGPHGHGIIRKCRPWPYEELVHIPLIVHCPGVEPGRVSALVQSVDLAPTILDYLGVDQGGERMQGQSLLPLMRGQVDKLRDLAIAGYYNFSWSIITEEWSFIHWLDQDKHYTDNPLAPAAAVGLASHQDKSHVWTCTPGSQTETPERDELYHRGRDPFQQHNLLEEHPGVAEELYQRLREFMLELRSQA